MTVAESLFNEGIKHYNKRNYAKAIELFKQAADMGSDDARCELAYIYLDGEDEQKSIQAAEWLKNAAAQGHNKAIKVLDIILQERSMLTDKWYFRYSRLFAGCDCCAGLAARYDVALPRFPDKVNLCDYCFEDAKDQAAALKMSAFLLGHEHVDIREIGLYRDAVGNMDRDTLMRYLDELEAESDMSALTAPKRCVEKYKRAKSAVPPSGPLTPPADERSAAESLLKARQSGAIPPTSAAVPPVAKAAAKTEKTDGSISRGYARTVPDYQNKAPLKTQKQETGVRPQKKLKTVLICVCLAVLVLAGAVTGIILGVTGGQDGLVYEAYGDGYMITGAADKFNETNLVIPDIHRGKPVLAINGEAFSEGTFTSVVIPASVKHIGYGAFQGCESLESAVFGEGFDPDSLDGAIFNNCFNLKKAVLPESMRLLGDMMFSNTGIGYIDLPALETVPYAAFYGCSKLQAVYIKEGCSYINADAFGWCAALKEVYFSGSTVQWENISGPGKAAVDFDDADAERHTITDVRAVDFTQKLMYGDAPDENSYAVYASWALFDRQSVIVPSSYNGKTVTAVGYTAFALCVTLSEITLPSTVTLICEYAFYGCSSLTKVNCPAALNLLTVENGNDILFTVSWTE